MIKRFMGVIGLLFIWSMLAIVFLKTTPLQAEVISEPEWRPVVQFQPDRPNLLASFGSAIAIDDEFMVVGAIHENPPNYMYSGGAYLFQKVGNDWSQPDQVAHLTPSEPATDLVFGVSVAIQGDTVVIGMFIFTKNQKQVGKML